MPRFAEDIDAALRWLRDDPRVEPARVVLLGHSVGAGASLLAASRDPGVAAVVSIAAMAHPGTLMRANMRARGIPGPVITVILREIERAIGLPFDVRSDLDHLAYPRSRSSSSTADATTWFHPPTRRASSRPPPVAPDCSSLPEADHASLDAFLLAAPAVTSFIQDAVRDGR